MEKDEMLLKELKEIKELIKKLINAQIETNDNIVTIAEEILDYPLKD